MRSLLRRAWLVASTEQVEQPAEATFAAPAGAPVIARETSLADPSLAVVRIVRIALVIMVVTAPLAASGVARIAPGGESCARRLRRCRLCVEQALELAAVEKDPAALAALVDGDAAPLVGAHRTLALGADEGSG